MTLPPVRSLTRRAITILRTEGSRSLLRHVKSYGGFLVARVVACSRSYLYVHRLTQRDETPYLPRCDSWEIRVIHSDADADAVAAEGLEDVRKVFVYSPRALRHGAIAFCIYVDRALAHVGWVALTSEAKKWVDRLPYRVDFDAGEACTGGTYTMERFRGRNLMAYGYYLRLEYMRQIGRTLSRNAVLVNNVASQNVHARFEPEIHSTGRFIKLLRWNLWKETPLPGGPVRSLPPRGRSD